MSGLIQSALTSLLVKYWPLAVPAVEKTLIALARKVLNAAKDGAFPESVKQYEPIFDAVAASLLVELDKIEAALLPKSVA